MKFISIQKKNWSEGLRKSKKIYQLFGHIKDENGCFIRTLDDDKMPDMQCSNSIMSAKSVLFPQTESILDATLDTSSKDHHIMKRVQKQYSPRAVVGIKPYDAKAIQLLRLNFDNKDYSDPYWCDAYDATTFIGLGINEPESLDFSTSVNANPFGEEGLDVLLADLGDQYLAKVLTAKGEIFVKACGFESVADEKHSSSVFDILKKQACDSIVSKVDTNELKNKSILDLYEADFWNDIAFSCINCGTCTFVCPTCWCFDIQDETKRKSTTRFRNWDTCMSNLFTLHASGHNPRDTKNHRVRQRFMHKLKYFLDKYDKGIMCVGCGRCIKSCPVNIDIREVISLMNSYEKQDNL